MRFDKFIDILTLDTIGDGQGGHTIAENTILRLNCNVSELDITTTMKIYGEATTDTIRATVLGKITCDDDKDKKYKYKFNNKYYKKISKKYLRNKTCYLLEVIEND